MFFREKHVRKGCSSMKNICMKHILPGRGFLMHIDARTFSCARVCVHAHSGTAHTPSCVYKNILHTHEEWVSGWVGRKVSGWVGGWVGVRRHKHSPQGKHPSCAAPLHFVMCADMLKDVLPTKGAYTYIYTHIYMRDGFPAQCHCWVWCVQIRVT